MKVRLLVLLVFYKLTLFAQQQKLENYKKFDARLLHFGVQMGINKTNFNLTPTTDAYSKYGYTSIENLGALGAQVGMVTSFKLGTPVLRLRFVPTFSFQERVVNYYSKPLTVNGKEVFNEERVNSSNLDFPLMLQLRTLRYGNFASYCLLGAQYSKDLQSVADKNQNNVDPFLKIKKNDYMAQFGGGIEFFAEYFKCGIELKYSQGFNNILIQDNTTISNPLHSLKNNSWILTITFEG